MKLRALSACVAVLVFAVACATTAQQPETQPAVVPTPTREPLDGEEIPIIIGIAYIPNGIISEETEAYLGENVLIGNPAKIRYYNDDHGETREFIGVIQEVLLPEKAYVDETSSFGSIGHRFKWPPGFPLGFPPEMTGTNTLSMDVFRMTWISSRSQRSAMLKCSCSMYLHSEMYTTLRIKVREL